MRPRPQRVIVSTPLTHVDIIFRVRVQPDVPHRVVPRQPATRREHSHRIRLESDTAQHHMVQAVVLAQMDRNAVLRSRELHLWARTHIRPSAGPQCQCCTAVPCPHSAEICSTKLALVSRHRFATCGTERAARDASSSSIALHGNHQMSMPAVLKHRIKLDVIPSVQESHRPRALVGIHQRHAVQRYAVRHGLHRPHGHLFHINTQLRCTIRGGRHVLPAHLLYLTSGVNAHLLNLFARVHCPQRVVVVR